MPNADRPSTLPSSELPITLDLWLWSLDGATPAAHAAYGALLNAEEQTRAAAFAAGPLKQRYVVGRGRMREILADALACAPQEVALAATAHGKPYLRPERHPNAPAFNLAHAGGWAALVTGPEGLTLGIDIEPVRPIDPEVAAISFSEAERAELATLSGPDWATGFFNGWTRKEAVVKALGAGLSYPLDSFDVTLRPGAAARVTRLAEADPTAWQLWPLALGDGFPGCIALCHRGDVTVALREGALPLRAPAAHPPT
ncbi:MAG: 4'-phosphopantetheinyl transferase superfamily protein [Pseudomonadota bacterium]